MQTNISPQKPHVFPASFTPEKREELFHGIVQIYALTDNILAAIQREPNPHRAEELELFTPFITQSINAANIISGFYTKIVQKNLPVTPEVKETIESALRNYHLAQRDIVQAVYDKFMPKQEG